MCLLCIYAIAVYYTMSSLENERVPSLDELCSKIPILSEYCAKLDDNVKRRYVEKIEIGVDPVTIPDQQFDTECLPPIEAMDLLSYLVLETSFYTKEQFKAYKSLEPTTLWFQDFYQAFKAVLSLESTLLQEK